MRPVVAAYCTIERASLTHLLAIFPYFFHYFDYLAPKKAPRNTAMSITALQTFKIEFLVVNFLLKWGDATIFHENLFPKWSNHEYSDEHEQRVFTTQFYSAFEKRPTQRLPDFSTKM